MDRRIIRVGLLGLVLVSVALGTAFARPKAYRKVSARTTPKKATATSAAAIHWQTDLEMAHRFSIATGRPMLVVFGAPWCTYCKKLENETMAHPSLVNYINSVFVPVHLDFEKDRRIAQVLEVKSLPTAVILSSEADLLGSIEGFVSPSEFSAVLQQSMEFQRTLNNEKSYASRSR
jgi:thioredoxin-related protein